MTEPDPLPLAVPLLCLDLDGTVRQGPDDDLGKFVNGPEDVRVFPEAVVMMRRWREAGGRIIGCSNQGGIALGYTTTESVRAAMWETWRQAEQLFDKIQWCSHHPNAQKIEDTACWCRKPKPGLIIEQAIELTMLHNEYYPPYMALMVGDREEDKQCAELAGIAFQDAREWRAMAKT